MQKIVIKLLLSNRKSGGNRSTYRLWTHILICFFFLSVIACSESPTGRRQLTLLPSDQVAVMGERSFKALKQSQGIEPNPRINAHVACVAEAIIDQLSTGPTEWQLVVFDDSSPNAFALPGGKIGINTGLFRAAQNSDQLATVIGHEVGHVLAQHANERLSQDLAVDVALALISMFISDQEYIPQDLAMQALGLGAQVGVLLPFSRKHESEADKIGLELMAQAGFDPRQSIALWQNMEKISSGQPSEFLSTHPSHDTRIQDLKENMESALRIYNSAHADGKKPPCG